MSVGGCRSPIHAAKIGASVKKYLEIHPVSRITKERISNSLKRIGFRPPEMTDEIRLRCIDTRIGIWYGAVKYPDQKPKYCELWDEDLRERIRAYWGYVSALSGLSETSKIRGTVRSISCHHVYYQPKACCQWDEDEKGYFALINCGSYKVPKIVKHYIDGDPNKFVTLTAKEHKQTDCDKLNWIKTFERIIEDNGGKCYFTKKEIDDLLSD